MDKLEKRIGRLFRAVELADSSKRRHTLHMVRLTADIFRTVEWTQKTLDDFWFNRLRFTVALRPWGSRLARLPLQARENISRVLQALIFCKLDLARARLRHV